jgi:hypothetical protein
MPALEECATRAKKNKLFLFFRQPFSLGGV